MFFENNMKLSVMSIYLNNFMRQLFIVTLLLISIQINSQIRHNCSVIFDQRIVSVYPYLMYVKFVLLTFPHITTEFVNYTNFLLTAI